MSALRVCPLHVHICLECCLCVYRDDGVGLAAPQVGVNIRLMVFNETAKPGDPAETVLVNPTILAKSKQTDMDTEGCLSFPGIYQKIEVGRRPPCSSC
jgi:peptide deformylase